MGGAPPCWLGGVREGEGPRAGLECGPGGALRRARGARGVAVGGGGGGGGGAVRALRRVFLPEQARGNYVEYVRWRAAQRVFSSAVGVMSTQALLRAVGVGARASLPAAAATNWVLKDGLGRLGKLAVVGGLGKHFDGDLKHFRFASSVAFNAASSAEMLAPLAANHFLLLASATNAVKSMALAMTLAVQPAFHRTFSVGENMADISAKGQAQHVVADNAGLALALALQRVLGGSGAPGPWGSPALLAFPALVSADLLLCHRELKAVHLRTLNQQRVQIGAQHFLERGHAPSLRAVSDRENVLLGNREVAAGLPLRPAPLRLCAGGSLEGLQALLRRHEGDGYVLSYARPRLLYAPGGRAGGLRLCMRDIASDVDLLMAALQAAHFRRLASRGRGGGGRGGSAGRALAPLDEEVARRWLDDSARAARRDVRRFREQMEAEGWAVRPEKLTHWHPHTYSLGQGWKKTLRMKPPAAAPAQDARKMSE